MANSNKSQTLSTITNQVQRSTTNKLQHESTQQRVQNCACVFVRCHWFLRFTFACWPLLHGQVCVGRNSFLLDSRRSGEFALGLQVPRIVRVVWAWLEGCAVAGGHFISSPIRGRPLMPVLCRLEERAQQVLKTPADAHPSQSAEVWEDTDFKELRPRPAQHRPHGASWHQHRPHHSIKAQPFCSATAELGCGKNSRSSDQATPGDESQEAEEFFPLVHWRVGLKATRRVRVECERSWQKT